MVTMQTSESSRVQALDLLRLVAVLAVVFYHYGFAGPIPQVAVPSIAAFARYGFLGVSAFFVISGFVIAYSTQGRTTTEFAIARVSRIYPTFVVCMTLTCVAVLVLGRPEFTATAAQWLANLFIAAPAFGEPYMDGAYWSLLIEIIFYGWIAVLIALGLFPRRIDAIILIWICITFANELTLNLHIIEKLFIADDSGFFAVGLLIYEFHRGRRDAALYGMFALSTGTAVFQAVHKLERLGVHTNDSFERNVVAVICLSAIAVIVLATRVRHVPLPPRVVLAIGGLTYPFYLLHMQMGYVIYSDHAVVKTPAAVVVIMIGIAVLAWTIWRYVEGPLHGWTKRVLTDIARRSGLPCSRIKAISRPDA